MKLKKEVKHDIIAFCTSITEQLTEEEARFFHFGITSSDVIDSAHTILIKKSLDVIIKDYKSLLKALHSKALDTKGLPCIGRSHGINAEPMSFGQKFLNHYSELYRRFEELISFYENDLTIQLSGAVGNYTIVTPEQEEKVAKTLGFNVEPVSSQIIARDRISKLMGIIANFSAGLERFCIEIRHLHHSALKEVGEGFSKGQKGSSIMPHKKNPISTENLSGISRLLRGYLSPALENNLLWHERDISHSSAERVFLPDALGLMSYSLRRCTSTVENLVIDQKRIQENIPSESVYFSSYILHQMLIKTDKRREELYALMQDLSFEAMESKRSFIEIVREKLSEYDLDLPQVDTISSIYLKHVDSVFNRVERIYPIKNLD